MKHPLIERVQTLEAQNKHLFDLLAKQNEYVLDLRRQRNNLRDMVIQARAGRDEWKRRARVYARRINSLRTNLYDARRSRDMWRTRALEHTIFQTKRDANGRYAPLQLDA
jgi:predicted RNase H-like nuclease (RuvC/YqgF family)